MPKEVKKLSTCEVERFTHGTVTGEGKAATTSKKIGDPSTAYHAVGGVAGLLLCCRPSGYKSWVYRVRVGDKRRDINLGSYKAESLAKARSRAEDLRYEIRRKGIDPILEKREQKSDTRKKQKTFDELAQEYIENKRLAQFLLTGKQQLGKVVPMMGRA